MELNNQNPMFKDKADLGQITPDLHKEKISCIANVEIVMSHDKILRYNPKDISIWRALFSTTYTFLLNWDTWMLLIYLTILCFATSLVIFLANVQSSMPESNVTNRVQFLLGFVLSTYASMCVGRWDRIRQGPFGTLWGALENMYFLTCQYFPGQTGPDRLLKDTLLRYCRCCMKTLFLAGNNLDDLSMLVDRGMLTESEKKILSQALVGTRPLVVIGWIQGLINKFETKSKNYSLYLDAMYPIIQNARGGVGGTLGILGAPIPFMYTHIVYWTVQMCLVVLAVETGINLIVMYDRKNNGDGQYDYDDPGKHYPDNPNRWYGNFFIATTCQNVVFALFTQGLLKVCDKVDNPLSFEDDHAFPHEAYDTFLINNCLGLEYGLTSVDAIQNDLNLHNHETNEIFALGPETSKKSNIYELNAVEFSRYLNKHGQGLESYAPIFEKRGIGGRLFHTISDMELLNDFNITDKYHRRALLLLKSDEYGK